jgi:hypothetical protein
MDFQTTDRYRATVEELLEAYADPGLPAALGPLAPLSSGELVEHRRNGDTVELRVRYAYQGDLPPGATRFVDPSKLTWVQVTQLRLTERRALVALDPDHYTDRLRASAVERFRATELPGTTREVEGRLAVRMVVVGRAVERALVSGLTDYLTEEAVAVDAWIAGRRPPG